MINYFALGGKIAVGTLKKVLKNGYAKHKDKNIDGYEVDQSMSGKRVQVLHNPTTKHTIVAHKGTDSATDWLTNLRYGLFNDKSSKRFKHSKKIQKQAEEKYKDGNFTTVGHSLGAKLAQESSSKGDIVTLNGATTPYDIGKRVPKNQTNIRTTIDPVSYLQNYQWGNGNEKKIESKSLNPISEHGVNVLDRMDSEQVLGSGINIPEYCIYYCRK
jgi:hypothetical protein